MVDFFLIFVNALRQWKMRSKNCNYANEAHWDQNGGYTERHTSPLYYHFLASDHAIDRGLQVGRFHVVLHLPCLRSLQELVSS